ncbi:NAD(P)-dependent oxidoreductase [Pseudarthrobacter cellobiosi]|uniref:NAD(P)-dependent oxidoreductase n=1 Tax=Pseudarthrobacter cellobiosi TaxID=2953654 RepID=UPI00208F66D9|nr:NAD(P)-dependent oxidoreductase [Pseudarthrobacter sp. HLT1-5]MCO4253724.1 hypothetical protein [Pseudarthrobacter sp. HLT1-5]
MGTASIERFLRPVAYQGFPRHLLPEAQVAVRGAPPSRNRAPAAPSDRAVKDSKLGEFARKVREFRRDELVAESDYVALHVPLNEDTHHLVVGEVLDRMKSSAVVEALRHGGIAGAGVDIFENERRLGLRLTELLNTILLPHMGSATVSVRAEMSRLSALNATAMASGRIPDHAATRDAWPRPPPNTTAATNRCIGGRTTTFFKHPFY